MSEFDPSSIGPFFSYNDGSVVTGIGVATAIVPANPFRVAIYFQAFTNTSFMRPAKTASATLGMAIRTTDPPLRFSMTDSGPLCQQAWSAFSVAAGAVYFLEILKQATIGE